MKVEQDSWTTTVFSKYCPLWSVKLHHDFVLKRHLRGWREEGVFKLRITLNPKRCETYWVYRNKSHS